MLFTSGRTDCKPGEVDYDEQRIPVLNEHLQRLIDEEEIQCASYCVSRYGKIFMHAAAGRKSCKKEDETPLTTGCVYGVASITKLFTATAIMKLVEDGLTRLDVPVGDILSQFNTPPYNSITLFHLLTHTSGMHADAYCYDNPYQTSYWGLIDRAYQLCDDDKKNKFDWIAAALGTIGSGLRVKPDTEWAYNSFGFVLLGEIIEKLTGVFAHKYIEENILKPLQMNDSGFEITKETAKRFIVSNIAGNIEEEIDMALNGTAVKHPLWDRIPSTAGGLKSTVYDLTRFGNMLLAGGTLDGSRVLGRKAVEKMTSISIHNMPDNCWKAKETDRGFGIGFDMRNGKPFTMSAGTYMHEGYGYSSLYIDPKERLVAAWFTPFVKHGWFMRPLYNVQNLIWSGII